MRQVIVTGGGSGIGAALCRAFGNRGDRVYVADRDAERASAVASAIPGAVGVHCDAMDADSVASLVDRAVDE